MSIEHYLAFVTATMILLVIPGPTILLVVSYALGQGWRAALPTAIGVALGDFTAMTLSLFGVGALLLASATLFTVLKWVGAAYLFYLGFKLFRAGGTLDAKPITDASSTLKMVGHAWLVDPIERTLEVYRLENRRWTLLDTFTDDAVVRAEPFDAIELPLSVLWED